MKKIIAILSAAALGAPAIAGPYANVEANSGWSGTDYGGTVIDNHLGYEGDNWYIQGGPASSHLMVVTALLNCLVRQVVVFP